MFHSKLKLKLHGLAGGQHFALEEPPAFKASRAARCSKSAVECVRTVIALALDGADRITLRSGLR
jgi:hypothetical protein